MSISLSRPNHTREDLRRNDGPSRALPDMLAVWRLPPDLAAQFCRHYDAQVLIRCRFALVFGCLLYGLFGILDLLLIPGKIHALWSIRLAVCCELIAAALLTKSSFIQRHLQPLLAVSCVVAGLGIVGMVAIIPAPNSYFYYAGLLLVFIFLYVVSGCRFIVATIAGWLLVLAYELVAILLIDTPINVVVNNNFFFISANLVCMAASFLLETQERQNFVLNWQLEEKVAQRTEQFRQANDELAKSRQLAALGMLTASIAHEFGTPLFAIRNFLEGLNHRDLDHQSKEIVALGIRECQRLGRLLRDLGNFNQTTVPPSSSIDPHPILERAALLLQSRCAAAGIRLDKTFRARGARIAIVAEQLHQVMLNILTNAVEAIQKGGRGDRIQLVTETVGADLRIVVQDNGPGLDPAVADKVFEPFVSTKEKKFGTGLGLAISYGIIKRHRGSLTVDSQPGRGCAFTITLPLAGDGQARSGR